LEATASPVVGKTRPGARRDLSSDAILLVVITVAAALLRLRILGDLVAHEDEQFYLLVGDRMLRHGAIPYVDIWDRKPVGLFLIYEAIRLLGGDGIAQYQVVASVFAAATAGLIGLWVRRAAGLAGGLVAGVLYLIILQAHGGFGGQAEVFMNLFVVAAGLVVFRDLRRSIDAEAALNGLAWRGGLAMLLIGLAAQIKPTALLPGLWLGLVLLLVGARARWSLRRLAAVAALWVLLAAAPTLLAAGWYAAMGRLDSFAFASTSILGKPSGGVVADTARRAAVAVRMGLLFGIGSLLLALSQWRGFGRGPHIDVVIFLLGWLAFGIAAYYALPAAYLHYALVADPMGCLIVGYAIGLEGAAQWIMGLGALAFAGRLLVAENARVAENRVLSPQVRTLAERIRGELHGGCLYVYHGPVVLYRLTDSCLVTRFAFPGHMSSASEASGAGVDPRAEVTAILDRRPTVVVDGQDAFHAPNRQTQPIVRQRLAADYEPFAEIGAGPGEPTVIAYRLKPAVQPLSSP